MQSLIVMGASVGGMEALSTIFAALPADFPAAILVVTHVGARKSLLPELLAKTSALPVRYAQDREPIRPGRILLAPPDLHMLVAITAGQATVELTRGPRENHTRPAIDPLFRSAAAAFGAHVVGVILSGYLDDGTVPIDNNHIENQIRPWALGRKNWLFAGSLRSGQRAAALMSLIQSAKLNGHDAYAYLKDVLTRLPMQRASEIGELLPHRWQPA